MTGPCYFVQSYLFCCGTAVWPCVSCVSIARCLMPNKNHQVFYCRPLNSRCSRVLSLYPSRGNHLLKEPTAYSFEAWEIEKSKKQQTEIHRGTDGWFQRICPLIGVNYHDSGLIWASAAIWYTANPFLSVNTSPLWEIHTLCLGIISKAGKSCKKVLVFLEGAVAFHSWESISMSVGKEFLSFLSGLCLCVKHVVISETNCSCPSRIMQFIKYCTISEGKNWSSDKRVVPASHEHLKRIIFLKNQYLLCIIM